MAIFDIPLQDVHQRVQQDSQPVGRDHSWVSIGSSLNPMEYILKPLFCACETYRIFLLRYEQI